MATVTQGLVDLYGVTVLSEEFDDVTNIVAALIVAGNSRHNVTVTWQKAGGTLVNRIIPVGSLSQRINLNPAARWNRLLDTVTIMTRAG